MITIKIIANRFNRFEMEYSENKPEGLIAKLEKANDIEEVLSKYLEGEELKTANDKILHLMYCLKEYCSDLHSSIRLEDETRTILIDKRFNDYFINIHL